MEASERLEAEPALMASSLKTLEQEATDQGYAWDSVVMVLQHVANASSEGDEPEQLMQAWQTCTASGGSIADFTAVLTDRFPEINSTFVELVELAREERRAMSGVAGGSHIGADFKHAGTATGNTLAKPWKCKPTSAGGKTAKYVEIGAEIIAAGALINHAFNTANMSFLNQRISRNLHIIASGGQNPERKLWGDSHSLNVQGSDILGTNEYGGIKITTSSRLGLFKTDFTFDTWRGRFYYEFRKMLLSTTWTAIKSKFVQPQPEYADANETESLTDVTLSQYTDTESLESHLSQSFTEEDLDIHGRDLSESMDINTRRMSEKILRTYDDLEIDNLSSKRGEPLSALSVCDQTLPGRVSAGLWDNARISVMSDLTGDMQYAERRAEASVSADISGIEDKELGAIEDI